MRTTLWCVILLTGCGNRPSADQILQQYRDGEAAKAAAYQEERRTAPLFSPGELRLMQMHEDMMRRDAALYRRRGDRPSDLADCTSRANAVLGDIVTKTRVQEDCLAARRLRRRGL